MKKLSELGFKKIGVWKKNENNIFFQLKELNDAKEVLFAFVIDENVIYIGYSPINFETFLQTYANPSDIDLEKIKIKKFLLNKINDNKITIYALKNRKFFGLLKKFSDYQISELITEYKPLLNSNNLKNRMKNIVGRDRTAVVESEKLKKLNKDKEEAKKAKKKYETYIFILGKSYYERGLFSVKAAYSHLVGKNKSELELILIDKDKNETVISARVSRTLGSSKTARIIGNKPLRIWFEKNTHVNDELRITFIDKDKIQLEIA